MARTNKEQSQEKISYNGFDSQEQGYPKTKTHDNQGLNIMSMGQKIMRNERLVGASSLVLGSVLLLNFFGFLSFFNYAIGAAGIALLVYGAWKLNLANKVKQAVEWFQGYLENNKDKK